MSPYISTTRARNPRKPLEYVATHVLSQPNSRTRPQARNQHGHASTLSNRHHLGLQGWLRRGPRKFLRVQHVRSCR
eukprot:6113473-Pleurochrysis_carterae.AAC.2